MQASIVEIDVTDLVPGDLVRLDLGQIVPADLRVVEATGLECDEAVLTGETMPVAKTVEAAAPGDSPLDLASCALMGTIVRSGSGLGVAVATGGASAFGRIAVQLGERHERTAFERGIRSFTNLLVRITGGLIVVIVAINLVRGQSILNTALFALAVAVGLTPQLLPALVSLSLARGSQRLAEQDVVVKRLVAIEDLGNIDVLYTDKTGTLTAGRITLQRSTDRPVTTMSASGGSLDCAATSPSTVTSSAAATHSTVHCGTSRPDPSLLDRHASRCSRSITTDS